MQHEPRPGAREEAEQKKYGNRYRYIDLRLLLASERFELAAVIMNTCFTRFASCGHMPAPHSANRREFSLPFRLSVGMKGQEPTEKGKGTRPTTGQNCFSSSLEWEDVARMDHNGAAGHSNYPTFLGTSDLATLQGERLKDTEIVAILGLLTGTRSLTADSFRKQPNRYRSDENP
ncbi:hypothetical protein Bbelb_356360 [Branchiostoma belcheri]|nr:hypothetical protein Bbelb_422960 [Branchiostoma belcheri]KAI8486661.1 hypothetical protein Bbelb_356360 [Branchiostoma belcheri]